MINRIIKVLDPLKGNKTKIGVVGILICKSLIAAGVIIPGWIIPVLFAWTGPSALGHVDRWIDKVKNS